MAGDIYWDKVVLAMHMDDTALADTKGHTITKAGSVARSATQSKFGGYSGNFPGSGSYITSPHSTDFRFGSDDFTVECWVYASSLPAEADLISKWNAGGTAGSNQWLLYLASGVPTFLCSTNGSSDAAVVTGPTMSTNTWTHLAVTRSGTTLRVYTAGTSGTPQTVSGSLYASETEVLGISYRRNNGSTQYPLTGYMDDIRITNGVARYTGSSLTVPTAAFPDRLPLISGVVRDSTNALAQRLVRAFKRSDASFLGYAISNATTGAYSISVATDEECFVVAHDVTATPPSGGTENAVILDRLVPA